MQSPPPLSALSGVDQVVSSSGRSCSPFWRWQDRLDAKVLQVRTAKSLPRVVP
jgi:hypothetical protein